MSRFARKVQRQPRKLRRVRLNPDYTMKPLERRLSTKEAFRRIAEDDMERAEMLLDASERAARAQAPPKPS